MAVGWLDREQINLPLAPYLQRKGIAFIAKAVANIDATGNLPESKICFVN